MEAVELLKDDFIHKFTFFSNVVIECFHPMHIGASSFLISGVEDSISPRCLSEWEISFYKNLTEFRYLGLEPLYLISLIDPSYRGSGGDVVG